MASNRSILNNLEFETLIKSMNDRTLLEFTARQVYEVKTITFRLKKRVDNLENRDRKFFGTIGGISGVIGASIVAALNFLFKNGQ